MMHAQYFQGMGSAIALAYGPVAVGMIFTPRGVPAAQGQTNPAPTPFLSSYSAPSALGTIGTPYTVTAVIPDPNANPNVGGSYPGDQVTLSILGTILASQLSQFYRVS